MINNFNGGQVGRVVSASANKTASPGSSLTHVKNLIDFNLIPTRI